MHCIRVIGLTRQGHLIMNHGIVVVLNVIIVILIVGAVVIDDMGGHYIDAFVPYF